MRKPKKSVMVPVTSIRSLPMPAPAVEAMSMRYVPLPKLRVPLRLNLPMSPWPIAPERYLQRRSDR